MASFGSALRNLGSVLNPQVAQELAAEDREERGVEKQLGMMALQQKIQQQSPEYQAKIQALENEKGFRTAVQGAGGDMTKVAEAAVQFGKPEIAMNLYSQQEQRAARLQQSREAIAARQSELEFRLADKAATREQQALAQAQLVELKKQGLALQGELAKGNQELKKMQFAMNADQKTKAQVRDLQGALEKANLPQADAVLTDVETALETNPKVAEWISGAKSIIPDLAAPQDVRSARQAFQKLFNITLKDRSGAAVTNQELERLKKEFATGAFKDEKQLKDAVEKARGIINTHYASVAGGFGAETLKAYNENIRSVGGKVVLDAPAKSTKPTDDDPLGLRK